MLAVDYLVVTRSRPQLLCLVVAEGFQQKPIVRPRGEKEVFAKAVLCEQTVILVETMDERAPVPGAGAAVVVRLLGPLVLRGEHLDRAHVAALVILGLL